MRQRYVPMVTDRTNPNCLNLQIVTKQRTCRRIDSCLTIYDFLLHARQDSKTKWHNPYQLTNKTVGDNFVAVQGRSRRKHVTCYRAHTQKQI
jgi:hypothetical protein